jgi:thymidylate synthase (FAD)
VYPVSVELIDHNAGGEATILKAARTCYDSTSTGEDADDRLLKHLIENGHHAMLEFGWAAFRIKCSRVVSHELVRHRICSWAQRSQRFVNESNPNFLTPPEFDSNPHAEYVNGIYAQAMRVAWNSYSSLLNSGVPKQLARYLLPNSTTTEIVMAANFRELRHFCQLRSAKQAQPEMREVATLILKELKGLAPRVFSDIPIPDGI